MAERSENKLRVTKDYKMFLECKENRPVDLGKRKDLRCSMQENGYLTAYPLHCVRNGKGLVVRDGQHRLAIAMELGLPVWYVVCNDDAAISQINSTQRPWRLPDYAGSYAAQGKKEYAELLSFAEQHGLPLSTCTHILSNRGGRFSSTDLQRTFKGGGFTITSRGVADRVARIYGAFGKLCPAVKTYLFAQALFAFCQVGDIDDARLISGAKRWPERLMKYGTRDGYLAMLEEVYNYGRHTKYPLKIEAENAMRSRNVCQAKQANP